MISLRSAFEEPIFYFEVFSLWFFFLFKLEYTCCTPLFFHSPKKFMFVPMLSKRSCFSLFSSRNRYWHKCLTVKQNSCIIIWHLVISFRIFSEISNRALTKSENQQKKSICRLCWKERWAPLIESEWHAINRNGSHKYIQLTLYPIGNRTLNSEHVWWMFSEVFRLRTYKIRISLFFCFLFIFFEVQTFPILFFSFHSNIENSNFVFLESFDHIELHQLLS